MGKTEWRDCRRYTFFRESLCEEDYNGPWHKQHGLYPLLEQLHLQGRLTNEPDYFLQVHWNPLQHFVHKL